MPVIYNAVMHLVDRTTQYADCGAYQSSQAQGIAWKPWDLYWYKTQLSNWEGWLHVIKNAAFSFWIKIPSYSYRDPIVEIN